MKERLIERMRRVNVANDPATASTWLWDRADQKLRWEIMDTLFPNRVADACARAA